MNRGAMVNMRDRKALDLQTEMCTDVSVRYRQLWLNPISHDTSSYFVSWLAVLTELPSLMWLHMCFRQLIWVFMKNLVKRQEIITFSNEIEIWCLPRRKAKGIMWHVPCWGQVMFFNSRKERLQMRHSWVPSHFASRYTIPLGESLWSI